MDYGFSTVEIVCSIAQLPHESDRVTNTLNRSPADSNCYSKEPVVDKNNEVCNKANNFTRFKEGKKVR